MAADKIKYFNKINILIILIWLIYPAVYYSKFSIHLPYNSNAYADVKKYFNQQNGISLIGGSNVAMGLSAETISTNLSQCHNFGIDSESGGFEEYINFLGDRIASSETIVYSTLIVWSDEPTIYNSNFLKSFNFIPPYSILSQIWKAFFSESSSYIRYNSYGDQEGYICGYDFAGYRLDYQKFVKNNNLIVAEIINRIEKIKKITKTDKVFIRIPPIYTEESRKKIIRENMNYRIKSLEEAGIIVVGEILCSSDKSLFCDNVHPNEKGRRLFSKDLKAALIKLE
jgi:hypothetical protein